MVCKALADCGVRLRIAGGIAAVLGHYSAQGGSIDILPMKWTEPSAISICAPPVYGDSSPNLGCRPVIRGTIRDSNRFLW
jgi:hypothetical protein